METAKHGSIKNLFFFKHNNNDNGDSNQAKQQQQQQQMSVYLGNCVSKREKPCVLKVTDPPLPCSAAATCCYLCGEREEHVYNRSFKNYCRTAKADYGLEVSAMCPLCVRMGLQGCSSSQQLGEHLHCFASKIITIVALGLACRSGKIWV
eukprot:TRINITY_DN13449_c0_g1_i1.p1 TRINITY_DN13449_c0_g1~~TRINITY_DN13449_c0_g1_i1.p1  ORF type:complete len:150 (+),score=32.17 TRINITY_DN13449_c0_g1_i1:368-817(+)